MESEGLELPGGHGATIMYLTKPPRARGTALWWLQLKKMGFRPGMHSEAYARDLPKVAKQFAAEVMSAYGIAPDLVVVPASESRQFQPYLNALVEADGNLSVLDGAFSKPAGFRAGDKGRTYDEVLDATVLDVAQLPDGLEAVGRIWIIDDIYNTGNTVGAMVTRLKAHLPALEEVVVVCPLYVPL